VAQKSLLSRYYQLNLLHSLSTENKAGFKVGVENYSVINVLSLHNHY